MITTAEEKKLNEKQSEQVVGGTFLPTTPKEEPTISNIVSDGVCNTDASNAVIIISGSVI